MRVGHTARFDHSGHNPPHTEVRVRHAATNKKKKGSMEVGGGARVKEEEKNGCAALFGFSYKEVKTTKTERWGKI